MADEDKSTSTVDTETEELDKSTNTEEIDKKDEASGDKATSASEEEDQGEEEDSSDQGDDKGDKSSTPTKKENKSGYLIRQLSNANPNVARLRERLQPWVDAATEEGEAKDRQREINDYIKDAARAQDDIVRDNEQVVREIPQFNARSDEFNEVLTRRAYAQYARDMAIEDQNGAVDANGNPIIVGYRMRLIDYMREKAEDYGFGSNTNAGPGKASSKSSNSSDKSSKAKAKMDAAADTPGGASGSSRKGSEDKDPFLVGFDDPYGRHSPTNAHAWSEK